MAKKAPTAKEKLFMSRVASLGCIISYCEDPRVELHHIKTLGTSKRASNWEIIGLCLNHHRKGGAGIAVHASGYAEWVELHGTEISLLVQVLEELGVENDD